MKELNLPQCTLDYAGRNLLPVMAIESKCEWNDCTHESNNFQNFLNHVQCHVHVLPMRGSSKSKKIVCEWRGKHLLKFIFFKRFATRETFL